MSSPFVTHGYTLAKRIHAGRLSEVYAAVRSIDGRRVVLKHYSAKAAGGRNPRAEWDALAQLAGEGIPRPLELIETGARPVLVLDHIQGVPLATWIETEPAPLLAFLQVAEQVSEILARVHAARLIHRDLSPWNVMVDTETLAVHLIDFGLSRRLGSSERRAIASSGGLKGSLHFIAPEQTGRMNRGCDCRSDLYSLGATLYFLLTRQPPFTARDPLELIHAHIARRPPPIETLRPAVPGPIARLVMKLLSKEPEDRYQSAAAVGHDLRALRTELASAGSLPEDFVLAAAEAQKRPAFSRELYGREAEKRLLEQCFSAVRAGSTRAVLVDGDPGVGKSRLIDTLLPHLALSNGRLVSAKFDPYRGRAYAGWADALESLAQQVLLESDAYLSRWRERLHGELGPIAGVIVELAPTFAFVLGDVPAIPALGPSETRARLGLAMRRAIRACASIEHPLVIFLDDLQWSDAASRNVLTDLLAESTPGLALLAIGAVRREAAASTTISDLIEQIERGPTPLERVRLEPLAGTHVAVMLAEALSRTVEDTADLARWIERKTQNNPLMVRQFLDHLHEEGLLQLRSSGGWEWDATKIAGLSVSEDAVGLLAAKLDRLDTDTRDVLCLASCTGDTFDADLLCELTDRKPQQIADALFVLSDLGLTMPCAKGFRFSHDRIREAARAMLTQVERERLHASMGQILLARTASASRLERIFEIADHLNHGGSHVPVEQRQVVLGLNLEAGARALALGAADSAGAYLERARTLWQDDDWGGHAAVGIRLFLLSAECALQGDAMELATKYLDEVEPRELDALQRAYVDEMRIRVVALTSDILVAVRCALRVLRRYGIRWPLAPSRLRAWLAIRLLDLRIGHRIMDHALHPARGVDVRRLATLIVLQRSSGLLARASGYLAMLATCYVFGDALRGGYVRPPNFFIACFATYQHLFVRKTPRTLVLARCALAECPATHLPDDPLQRPRTELMVHGVLYPFLMRRREALAAMPDVARRFRELGDVEWTFYSEYLHLVYLALAGDPVRGIEKRLSEVARSRGAAARGMPDVERATQALTMLRRKDVAEAQREARVHYGAFVAGQQTSAQGITLWMQTLCVWGQNIEALALAERLAPWLEQLNPWVHVLDHVFYRGLAAAGAASGAGSVQRMRWRRLLAWCIRYLERWRQSGPDFEHMILLLSAERARLRSDFGNAGALYERAARRARRQEFIHHAALCHERRAQMLQASRRTIDAEAARSEAAALYRAWGAAPKAAALMRGQPQHG
jgi:hypothetical protein